MWVHLLLGLHSDPTRSMKKAASMKNVKSQCRLCVLR